MAQNATESINIGDGLRSVIHFDAHANEKCDKISVRNAPQNGYEPQRVIKDTMEWKQIHETMENFLCPALRSPNTFAVASRAVYDDAWRALAADCIGDTCGYCLILALDTYRNERFCDTRTALSRDFGDVFLRSARITTCAKLDQLFIDYARAGRSQELRAILKRCWRIFVPISELDLASATLAYWEWLKATCIGDVPVTYVCQSDAPSERLTHWLASHGVEAAYLAQPSEDDTTSETTGDEVEEARLPKLILGKLERSRDFAAGALICGENLDQLRQFSEGIHRCGGTAHAYFAGGERRGRFSKDDTGICLAPCVDDVSHSTWRKLFHITPHHQACLKQTRHAVFHHEFGAVAYDDATLLATLGVLADVDDDLETLMPGRFWRTVLGAYLTFSRIAMGLPVPTVIETGCARAFGQRIQSLVAYWLEAGWVTQLWNGCLSLTEAGHHILGGCNDLLQLGGQFMHATNVWCVTPTNERLGILTDLVMAWTRNDAFLVDGHAYEHVFGEYSMDGVNLMRPTCLEVTSAFDDASNAILSGPGMHTLWRMLRDGAIDTALCIPNARAQKAFHETTERFSDVLEHPDGFIETTEHAFRWWTLGGAIHNSVYATAFQTQNDVARVTFSNASITVVLKHGADNSENAIRQRLNDLTLKMQAPDEAFLNAYAQNWPWMRTARRWLTLLGGRWQREYLASVLQRATNQAFDTTVPIREVDTFHALFECQPTSLPNDTLPPSDAVEPKPCPCAAHDEPATPPTDAQAGYYQLKPGDGSQMHTHLPWSVVRTEAQLRHAIDVMLKEPVIGLDTETTLYDQRLCLVQIGCRAESFLIDPLCVDVRPLSQVLSNPKIVKVIHNKSFEIRVLGKLGISIYNIIDTLVVSRNLYGRQVKGHKLKDVCLREFGYSMDKENQTSDWSKRPLVDDQLEYAALDAEIMIHLYCHFFGAPDKHPVHMGV